MFLWDFPLHKGYFADIGCFISSPVVPFVKDLSLAAIRGYRSAIKSIHKGFSDGSSISNASVLPKLFQAFSLNVYCLNFCRPLGVYQEFYGLWLNRPFEPMGKSSLLNLPIKTCFLLAVASCQRRSAIHALTKASGHI